MTLTNASTDKKKVTKSTAKVLDREEISMDGISKTFDRGKKIILITFMYWQKTLPRKFTDHDAPFLFAEVECLKKINDEEENRKIL